MPAFIMRWLTLLLIPTSTAAASRALPVEEINLDLAPQERWRDFVLKYRKEVISKAVHLGKLFKRSLGQDVAAKWFTLAPVGEELLAEYQGIVKYANHSRVTLERLVITDMWQAVDSPTFECSAVLAAMANGTVIHGRNIDYDLTRMSAQASLTKTNLAGGVGGFFEGVLTRGGRPVSTFLGSMGSLGIHTGMRLGAYSINSNARFVNNTMPGNLKAMELGGLNFPWIMRHTLQNVADYDSAVRVFETTAFNAANYFILAGSKPWQGAVITRDRLGTHSASTPPTQTLNKRYNIWHLVQTNDDLLSPPTDARRGAALLRLAQFGRSHVDEDFVLHQMLEEPLMNPDTLITWVANPLAGTYRVHNLDMAERLKDRIIKITVGVPDPRWLPEPSSLGAGIRGSPTPQGNQLAR